MVQKVLRLRVVRYGLVALLPLGANFLTLALLLKLDAPLLTANMYAVAVGSQVSFWSHDRITFGDRHTSVTGWFTRWTKFMPGQLGGFMVNSLTAGILIWFGARPLVVWVCALLVSGGLSFTWNNWVSHRKHYIPRHRATRSFSWKKRTSHREHSVLRR